MDCSTISITIRDLPDPPNKTSSLPNLTALENNHQFDQYKNKKQIVIDGLANIPLRALKGSAILEKVVLGDSIKIIGAYAFANCKNLCNIRLSNNLTTICRNAFKDCNLQYIFIPDSVSSIASNALPSSLKKISVPYHFDLTKLRLPDTIKIIRRGIIHLFKKPLELKKHSYILYRGFIFTILLIFKKSSYVLPEEIQLFILNMLSNDKLPSIFESNILKPIKAEDLILDNESKHTTIISKNITTTTVIYEKHLIEKPYIDSM